MDELSLSAAQATFQDYLSTSSLCWHPKREFIIAYGVDLETEARPTNSLSNSEATPIWGLGSAAAVIMGEGASGFDFCSGMDKGWSDCPKGNDDAKWALEEVQLSLDKGDHG